MEKLKIKYHTDIDHVRQRKNGEWLDLRAAEDVYMKAGDYRMISLGISIQLPEGYEALVIPRSSTFKNYGILMVNSMGLIDEKFSGDNDVIQFPALAITNTEIHKNDRICQMRLIKHMPELNIVTVETLGNPDRGGFGSTGIQ